MAGITLAQAEAQLAIWMAADAKVAAGQAYEINGRSLTRANAMQIRENIEIWDRRCQELSGTTNVARKIRVYGATPV